MAFADLSISMDTGHCFRESNKGLKLSYCVPIASLRVRVELVKSILSQITILFLQHLSGFFSENWSNCLTNFDVSLESFHIKVNFESLILKSMHVDNMLGDQEILFISLLILDDEE